MNNGEAVLGGGEFGLSKLAEFGAGSALGLSTAARSVIGKDKRAIAIPSQERILDPISHILPPVSFHFIS
jgi:hypothetical protein